MTRTAVLCGLRAWLPPTVVTNDDLAKRLDSTDEWIRTRAPGSVNATSSNLASATSSNLASATSDLAVEAGAGP
ncbi:hypothetical protein [Streptomyces sp. NBC_01717]|uniref:hypothetical protein n=1 Tax=Streptomyces sp. NBC_01717 TaxID=2975918 RepID=UPI002E2F0C5D|nr:hypothetical protein [Streptomyces sp. NBC_01717]